MSLANILLMDPEIRSLLKKAKDLSKDSPSKKEFAALVLDKNLRQITLHETGEPVAIEKEQNILTGRRIEELKQQNPEIFEEELQKQAENETEQLRKDMQQLAWRSSIIMKDFTDKFLNRCTTDFEKGFETLTSDENIDNLVNQELAQLPDDISKAILEEVYEVKKEVEPKPE